MRTYAVTTGDTLVFSVCGLRWETATVAAGDIAREGEATAVELSSLLNRSGTLSCTVDDGGTLVLVTTRGGAETTIEVDPDRSTAAAALGLSRDRATAQGRGLSPARLRSPAREPFDVAPGAELELTIDGRSFRVTFVGDAITAGRVSADEVCSAVNHRKRVAAPMRDGRVLLESPSSGPNSRVIVGPGRPGKPDAAAALGFVGAAASAWPHPSEPAELVCTGPRDQVRATNRTTGSVELHLLGGSVTVPPGASVAVSGADLADPVLQRFSRTGVLQLTRGAGSAADRPAPGDTAEG